MDKKDSRIRPVKTSGRKVVKKEYAGDKNIVYYTRSAMQAENELYEYFWAIGGANNYATYPSYISLGTSFAFCI